MELLKDVLASRGMAGDLYPTPSEVEPIEVCRRAPILAHNLRVVAFNCFRNGITEIYWRFRTRDDDREEQILREFARREFFLDSNTYELMLVHDAPTINYFHVVGGYPSWS